MAQWEPTISQIESAGAQLAYIAEEKAKGVWNPTKFLGSFGVFSVSAG
jgi:hypothetical protein